MNASEPEILGPRVEAVIYSEHPIVLKHGGRCCDTDRHIVSKKLLSDTKERQKLMLNSAVVFS